MSFIITPRVAEFWKQLVPAGLFPLRLTTDKKSGCGDVVPVFNMGEKFQKGDSEIAMHGVSVLCNFAEHPYFVGSTVDLEAKSQGGIPFEQVVVRTRGGSTCGCGQAIRLSDDNNQEK